MPSTKNIFSYVTVLCAVIVMSGCGPTSYKTAEECVLDKMNAGLNDRAAMIAHGTCHQMYRSLAEEKRQEEGRAQYQAQVDADAATAQRTFEARLEVVIPKLGDGYIMRGDSISYSKTEKTVGDSTFCTIKVKNNTNLVMVRFDLFSQQDEWRSGTGKKLDRVHSSLNYFISTSFDEAAIAGGGLQEVFASHRDQESICKTLTEVVGLGFSRSKWDAAVGIYDTK